MAWALPALAPGQPTDRPVPNEKTVILPAAPEICALLDDPAKRGLMDGLLFNLAWSCGRAAEFTGAGGTLGRGPAPPQAPTTTVNDVQVNNSAGEIGPSSTQSETSLAVNKRTGTLCSGFNDSWEFFGPTGGGGLTGFSRSTNGGATWQDGGAVGGISRGDPSVVWRQADGNFYFATLASPSSLAVWVSTDDCQSFSFLSTPATGGDDKELMAVDNNPASPHYGNLYLVWTDFGFGGGFIRAVRSTDGGVTWSAPFNLSPPIVQGAWPAVAPNGDVYVAWLRYASFPNGNITVEVARSTDGGVTYAQLTSPLANAASPRDLAASSTCGRPALNGLIRYLASPQIAVDAGGNLHIIYSYDPDGVGSGDVVNVYYRRSTDGGLTWGPELQLNDDSTNDQYFPAIQVSDGRTLMATWYDRRMDAGNLLQDYFKSVSIDGGLSWFPNVRLTDVSSPVHLDPQLAFCYHGDYDQSAIANKRLQVGQWSDDRNVVPTNPPRNDPDVWSERGNCFQGKTRGKWVTPTVSNQSFSGILRGSLNTDPTLWNMAAVATPGGSVTATLTGANPIFTKLSFSGTWTFAPGSTTTGQFSGAIFGPASLSAIGKLAATWSQPVPTQSGRFGGDWKICLQ